jgi:hypothetical protein
MRPIPIAGAVCSSVILIACSAGASRTSPPVSPDSTESFAPSPSWSASPSQGTAFGDLLEGFGWNDILRLEVNDLAVRRGPYTNMPLATGYTLDGASIGEVRLDAGDYVSVDLGPVQIGDTTWYRVWPAEGGQLHYSTVSWDIKNNRGNQPGWVAASVGPNVYLTLHQAFESDPGATGLPRTLLVSGTGDYRSAPQDGFDYFGLYWVYLIDDQGAPCDFVVTVEPVGGGQGVVGVSESTTGYFEEGQTTVNRDFAPYQLAVASGCEWSLRLEPFAHD